MKTATVRTDNTGYWVAKCDDTGDVIYRGRSELEAYKVANFNGYLCG